jgi:hypothetical protein
VELALVLNPQCSKCLASVVHTPLPQVTTLVNSPALSAQRSWLVNFHS